MGNGQGKGVTAGGYGTVDHGKAPKEQPSDMTSGQRRNERVAANSTTNPK